MENYRQQPYEPELGSENILPYNVVYKTVIGNERVVVETFCNGYEVINLGTSVVTVNGRPLYPGVPGTSNGDSVSFGGNRGEVFKGRIDISFDATTGNKALVTQKSYLVEQMITFKLKQ